MSLIPKKGFFVLIILINIFINHAIILSQPIEKYSHIINKPILSTAFSPSGRVLATLSADKTIIIWDSESGKFLRQLSENTSDGDVSICFSPDGRNIASANWDKSIKIWDISARRVIQRLHGHNQAVRSLVYHPSGNFIASAGWDNDIKIWYVPTGVNISTLKGHNQTIRAIDYSPDGKYLASGGYDLLLKIWNAKTGEELVSIKAHNFPLETLAYSPDGKFIATAGLDNLIKIWNSKTGALVKTLRGHTEGVFTLAYSVDGKYLATGGNDNIIKIWDVDKAVCIENIRGHQQGIRSISFSPNGKYLASAGVDRSIRMWDISYLKIPEFESEYVNVNNDSITITWSNIPKNDLTVFKREFSIDLKLEDTRLNHFQIFTNKKEYIIFNGTDTITPKPKSIKKFPDYIEISYDIYLEYGDNELQFFAQNIDNELFACSEPIIINCFDIENQSKKSDFHIIAISPESYFEKKWKYNYFSPEQFIEIITSQEKNCFKKVLSTSLTNPAEITRDRIQADFLDILTQTKQNDFFLLIMNGFFVKNEEGNIFYVTPHATRKNMNDNLLNIDVLVKSLQRFNGFTGVIIDVSQKPSSIPKDFEIVSGKEVFNFIQQGMAEKKHTMLITCDNDKANSIFEMLSNSFHVTNDVDNNKAIDFEEISIFLRKNTSSQFYFRGELFPLFLHFEEK